MSNFIRKSFDSYINYRYCEELPVEADSQAIHHELIRGMKQIVELRMDSGVRKFLNDLLIKIGMRKEDPEREELKRTVEWLNRLEGESKPTALPHLCHMASMESVAQKLRWGSVIFSSRATPGAWFSSQPELMYGCYGLLLDIEQAPRADFGYFPSPDHEEIGFTKPFNFKRVAGVVVLDRAEADNIRTAAKMTKEELPDDIFVTAKEATFRCWLTREAVRKSDKLPFKNLAEYLVSKGCKKVDPYAGLNRFNKRLAIGAAVSASAIFLSMAGLILRRI